MLPKKYVKKEVDEARRKKNIQKNLGRDVEWVF